MIKKIKVMINSIGEKALEIKIIKDQKGGPGLEEAVLLLFIGIAVATGANGLGGVVGGTFTSVQNTLKTTLGMP